MKSSEIKQKSVFKRLAMYGRNLPLSADFGDSPYPVIFSQWSDPAVGNQVVSSTFDGTNVKNWISIGVDYDTGNLDSWDKDGVYKQVIRSHDLSLDDFSVDNRAVSIKDRFAPANSFTGNLEPVNAAPLQYSVIKVIEIGGTWNSSNYMVFDIDISISDVGWGSDNWILSAGFVHDDDISAFTEGGTADYLLNSPFLFDALDFTGNTSVTGRRLRSAGAIGNMADAIGNYTIKGKTPLRYDSASGFINKSINALTKTGKYYFVIAAVTETVPLTTKVIGSVNSLKLEIVEPTDSDILLKLNKVGIDINLKD